jgi:hypothetical protein
MSSSSHRSAKEFLSQSLNNTITLLSTSLQYTTLLKIPEKHRSITTTNTTVFFRTFVHTTEHEYKYGQHNMQSRTARVDLRLANDPHSRHK